MSGGTRVSVIVPCFNEAARIDTTIERLARALDAQVPDGWEIVVVDDGSSDGTRAVAETAASADSRVRVTAPGRTAGGAKGKGAAVRCGLLAAAGEFVLVSDADLAGSPDQLSMMLARIGDAAAAVGTRVAPGAVVDPPRSLRRRVPAAIFRRFTRVVAGLDVSDPQCGFKLYRRAVVAPHFEALLTDGYAFEVELLLRLQRAGAEIVEVPIRWTEGPVSSVRVLRDGARMVREVLSARRVVSAAAVVQPAVAGDELEISVVMPVYNEASVIETVVKDVRHHVLDAIGDPGGSELVIVDDRGDDGSSAIIAAVASEDPRIRLLVNDKNLGHGPSVLRGLDAARGRWRLQLDSDGQVDLDDFAAMWSARDDADLVIATRVDRRDPRHRLVLTRVANLVVSAVARRRVRDSNAGFKLISGDLYRHLRPTIPSGTFAPSMLLVVGALRSRGRVAVVPVVHHARPAGTSSLRLRRLVRAAAIAGAQTARYALRPVSAFRR